MFGIFKKKEKNKKIPLQVIKVKGNKKNIDFYKGKFVSIEVADNVENYYFVIYDNKNNSYQRITNKVDKRYFELCSKFNYGLIYDYDGEYYSIAIICKNGYLKTYDVNLKGKYNNGESFIIDNNNLIDNNKVVGEIKNNNNEVISMNCLENNKLICFIEK